MGNGSISGCCKEPQVHIAAVAITNIETPKKEIRNGNIRFYPGVRTSDNKQTSPVLSIRTWDKSSENMSMQRGNLSSIQGSGDGFQTQLTGAGRKDEYKLDLDGDIYIIPVEDVIKIKISTKIKKTVEHNTEVRVRTPLPEDSGCCSCFGKTKVAPHEHVVKTSEKTKAARAIVLTVEYLRYSLVHTPSNVQVLSAAGQQDFYQKHLAVDTLIFYYLNNYEFQGEAYQKQLDESEALTRVVLQLKAMCDKYPDSSQLQQILVQQNLHLFGVEADETMVAHGGSGTVTTAVQIQHNTTDN